MSKLLFVLAQWFSTDGSQQVVDFKRVVGLVVNDNYGYFLMKLAMRKAYKWWKPLVTGRRVFWVEKRCPSLSQPIFDLCHFRLSFDPCNLEAFQNTCSCDRMGQTCEQRPHLWLWLTGLHCSETIFDAKAENLTSKRGLFIGCYLSFDSSVAMVRNEKKMMQKWGLYTI